MKRLLACLTILGLAACAGGDVTTPTRVPAGPASFSISDGAHTNGNPDFFFLPPMVSSPTSNANFDANGFDGGQTPQVVICTEAGTGEASFVSGCVTTITSLQLSSADVSSGEYHVNWKVPDSDVVFYRVDVQVDGTSLGYADLETGSNGSQLKNVTTGDYVPLVDGRTLPIKFRIEKGALCSLSSFGCNGSGVVNLRSGGEVKGDHGGVRIPPQGNGGPTTITVASCPDIPSDLRHFGSCVRVTANPPLTTPLTVPATVFVCNAEAEASVLGHPQEDRVTLHRYDAPSTQALPHASDDCLHLIGAVPTVGQMFANLLHGRLKSAGHDLVALVGPKPLYALHQGGGGESVGFSDFQFLLPAWMEKCLGDHQVADVGATLSSPQPTVCVRDVLGDPVAGATVHFATMDGSVAPASVTTGVNGQAAVDWTLGTLGTNTLTASGNGLAGDDHNGPRSGVDPFQPLDPTFDGSNGPAVPVVTGAVQFTATGQLPYGGASGWSYQIDNSPPANWYSTTTSPFSATGSTPFGSANTDCDLNNAGFSTDWPSLPLTYLYARRSFTLATAATVSIGVAIDNDVQVFLDGTDITSNNDQLMTPVNGVLVHEGCPTPDWVTFQRAVVPGSHILAILAKDRGISSYLDVRVSIQP